MCVENQCKNVYLVINLLYIIWNLPLSMINGPGEASQIIPLFVLDSRCGLLMQGLIVFLKCTK